MKIITNITGTIEENGTWHDPRGRVTALLDEPQPGYLRKIHLNGGGLTVESGAIKVGIPLAALLQLVEQCEPGLVPPPPDGGYVQRRAREIVAAENAKRLGS